MTMPKDGRQIQQDEHHDKINDLLSAKRVILVNTNGAEYNVGGGGDGAIVDGVNSAIKATVLDYTNSNPVAVRLTNTDGDYVTAGGGTQYTEGDVDTTITGTAMMWEDTGDTLRAVSATKPLPVDITDSTIAVTQSGTLNIGTVTTLTGVTGVVHIDDNASTISVDDGAGSLTVDGTITANLGTIADVATQTTLSALNTKVTVCNTGAIAGSVTANAGTGNFTVIQGTGTNLHTVVDSGSITADTELTTADLDTGVGTDTRAVVGIVGSASGGGQLIPGSSTDGLLVNLGSNNDVTVASGTITATQATGANLHTVVDSGTISTITNVVHVDDNSGSLTVDGTITANAGTGNFTVIQNTASNLNCTEANSGSIKTAVELVDDAVYTDGIGTPSKGIAVMGTDGTNPQILSTNTTGHVNIADGGNIITVDGTVTANLGTIAGVATETTLAALNTKVTACNTGAVTISAALPAGTNAIGKLVANSGVDIGDVDVLSIAAGNNNIGDVDVASIIPGTGATNLGKAIDTALGLTDTGVLALAVRDDTLNIRSGAENDCEPFHTDAAGALWVDPVGNVAHDAADAGNPIKIGSKANAEETAAVAENDRANIGTDLKGNLRNVGNVAHDTADTGNPMKIGCKAIAHGTNPTAVAAADRTDLYANRAGVQFVIAGHPNVVCFRANYTAAQTDTAIVSVSAGAKIVVTRVEVTADNANTVDTAVRIGFGAANTPTTTGVLCSHPGIAAGSGTISGSGAGILGVGADGEDLRITCTAPTTGSVDVVCSYYTIES